MGSCIVSGRKVGLVQHEVGFAEAARDEAQGDDKVALGRTVSKRGEVGVESLRCLWLRLAPDPAGEEIERGHGHGCGARTGRAPSPGHPLRVTFQITPDLGTV